MKPATLFIALALSGTSVIARPSLSHPTFPSLKQLFTRISRFFHPLEAVDELVDAIPFLPSRDPHPWLVANAPHLARLRTALVAQQLCNTSSPLYLDPGRGRTPPPPDLFAAVAVDTNSRGYTSTAAGWWAALEALDALAACPPALAAATRLKVDVYVSTYVSGQGETSPLPPPEAVLRRFAAVLPRMRGLRDVAFGVPPEHAAALARVLAEADVRLPGVRRLRLGRGLEALVGMCPDVEEVVGGGYEDHWSWNHYVPGLAAGRTELVKAVGAAGRGKGGRVEGPGVLSTLRLDSGWNGWEDQQLLEAVVEFFPDVVTLEMKGILERGGYYDRGDATILRKTLGQLARLPNLKHLMLPYSSELGLGFDGGAWCGNAYDGAGGRAYGREVVKESVDTAEMASKLTMAELPGLESLHIGGSVGNITRVEVGGPQVLWPWSGRVEEYALEAWPL